MHYILARSMPVTLPAKCQHSLKISCARPLLQRSTTLQLATHTFDSCKMHDVTKYSVCRFVDSPRPTSRAFPRKSLAGRICRSVPTRRDAPQRGRRQSSHGMDWVRATMARVPMTHRLPSWAPAGRQPWHRPLQSPDQSPTQSSMEIRYPLFLRHRTDATSAAGYA